MPDILSILNALVSQQPQQPQGIRGVMGLAKPGKQLPGLPTGIPVPQPKQMSEVEQMVRDLHANKHPLDPDRYVSRNPIGGGFSGKARIGSGGVPAAPRLRF